MWAYQIQRPGGPEVLQLQKIPDPHLTKGSVRIRIKAFGLNRAEVVTRKGGSGNAVPFPRVIGIECVGEVMACADGVFLPGQKVAAVMGGMGRTFDGSYAEQTVVPRTQVMPIESTLDWANLAAIPETYLTAWGCLNRIKRLLPGQNIMVRPGASALGIAITQMVRDLGGSTIGVTRSAHKRKTLLAAGMSEVLVSAGPVAAEVRKIWPEGADGVVETVTSALTVKDDLEIKGRRGRLCIAGSLSASSGDGGGGFSIMAALARPSVRIFSSEKIRAASHGPILQNLINKVEAADYTLHTASVFSFGELVEAHRLMDQNAFCGKVVIVH